MPKAMTKDKNKLKTCLDKFLQEFLILRSLSSKSGRLINYLSISATQEHLVVVSDYFENGSVRDRFDVDGLSERQALKYFYQTLKAVKELHNHSPPVIHGNIKASNLLLTSRDEIKLSDFGFVKEVATDDCHLDVFEIYYAAPERIDGSAKLLDKSTDVWALGCTLVEMLTGNPPHKKFYEHHKSGTNTKMNYTSDVLIASASGLTKFLVDQMFEPSFSKRISVDVLLYFIEIFIDDRSKLKHEDVYEKYLQEAIRQAKVEELYHDPHKDLPQKRRQLFRTQRQASFSINSDYTNGSKDNSNPHHKHGIVAAPLLAAPLLGSYGKRKSSKSIPTDLLFCCSYFWFRIFYFVCILAKTISYMLIFLGVGFLTLSIFLLVAFGVVVCTRVVIAYFCECDLNSPNYLIISGIFMILLFALLFSCCIMGLGEIRFRLSSKFQQNDRPDHDVKFCGVTVIKSKNLAQSWQGSHQVDPINHHIF